MNNSIHISYVYVPNYTITNILFVRIIVDVIRVIVGISFLLRFRNDRPPASSVIAYFLWTTQNILCQMLLPIPRINLKVELILYYENQILKHFAEDNATQKTYYMAVYQT